MEVITVDTLVFVWVVLVSILAFGFMGYDKAKAPFAESSKDRTPEGVFFFLAILGGTLGVYVGMFVFRHKTRKWYFAFGLPILLLQQVILLSILTGVTFYSPL